MEIFPEKTEGITRRRCESDRCQDVRSGLIILETFLWILSIVSRYIRYIWRYKIGAPDHILNIQFTDDRFIYVQNGFWKKTLLSGAFWVLFVVILFLWMQIILLVFVDYFLVHLMPLSLSFYLSSLWPNIFSFRKITIENCVFIYIIIYIIYLSIFIYNINIFPL